MCNFYFFVIIYHCLVHQFTMQLCQITLIYHYIYTYRYNHTMLYILQTYYDEGQSIRKLNLVMIFLQDQICYGFLKQHQFKLILVILYPMSDYTHYLKHSMRINIFKVSILDTFKQQINQCMISDQQYKFPKKYIFIKTYNL